MKNSPHRESGPRLSAVWGSAPGQRLFRWHQAQCAAQSNDLEVLRAKGHDAANLVPKDIDTFHAVSAPNMDFVFTVCDRADNKDCPISRCRPNGRGSTRSKPTAAPQNGRWRFSKPMG